MAGSRKIVKVFLGSPGDLAPERAAAKRAVDRFNQVWADYFGVHVELVGWEQIAARAGRPQDLINRELLDQCDLFVGMLWKYWGSPPGGDEGYTSGFEEEFERSLKRRKETGKPEMSLLFKDVNPDQVDDPGIELKKVLDFKDKIKTDKPVLYGSFGDLIDFEQKFDVCVTKYVQTLAADEEQKIIDEGSASTTSQATGTAIQASSQGNTPLGSKGADFLRQFVAKTGASLNDSPLKPEEVARFRLLGRIVTLQGNDEGALGVHDSNLLFSHRAELDLGQREMDGLLLSGLEHLPSQVTPLWHWYVTADAKNRCLLETQSFVGQAAVRVGALKALTMLQAPLDLPVWLSTTTPDERRGIVVRSWFEDGADWRLRVAALEYLAANGLASDIPVVQAEVDRKSYQTIGPATEALLRLALREGRDVALGKLLELQPETVAQDLVDELFANPGGIATASLLPALTHRSAAVRRAVLPVLIARDAVGETAAEQLLKDADARVRRLALQALAKAGRDFSIERAQGILVKPSAGLGGVFAPVVPDTEGAAQLREFRRDQLNALSIASLTKLVNAGIIIEQDARFVLDRRKFVARGAALRAAIDDNFATEFRDEVKKWEARLENGVDTVKRLVAVEEAVRKGLMRAGLDVLCEIGDPQDLPRIRRGLSEGFADYSDLDIRYLEAHGAWQDISLLVKVFERVTSQGVTSLLLLGDNTKSKSVAQAVAKLAKGRLADLLAINLPARLRPHVIACIAESDIASLGEDNLIALLLDENDRIRLSAALKAVRTLSKTKLKSLLVRYMQSNSVRYYNVIHWLDFGISMSKVKVTRGAGKVLRSGVD